MCLSETTSDNVYSSGDAVKLPVKWMALESLSDGHFSEKSDVVCVFCVCHYMYVCMHVCMCVYACLHV